MEWDDVFPWFTLAILGALGLAVKSSRQAHALRAGLDTLTDRVGRLDALVQRLQTPPPWEPAPPAPATDPSPTVAVELPPAPAMPEVVPLPSGFGSRWEQVLAENWLVWLGGLALALGGGFLVKLSIDYGLLTPSVRVVLGVLLGVGLALGGDWVARREPAPGLEETTPSYVPQALAAAGAATVFASLYAAYQLDELLPAGLAFPLLAGTAAGTVVMSLRHGPLVAALGLVGAYFVPLSQRTPLAIALAVLITSIGIPAATRVARASALKDPPFVVIDEVAGQLLALIAVPLSWKSLLAGFILFRAFDIIKPPPVRQLEALPEGAGIVLDDVAAGICALAVVHLLLRFGLLIS